MVTSKSGFTLGSGVQQTCHGGSKHALHGSKLVFGLKIGPKFEFCFLKLYKIWYLVSYYGILCRAMVTF